MDPLGFKHVMSHLFEKHRWFQASIATLEHPIHSAKIAVATRSQARLLRRNRPHRRTDSTSNGSE